MAKETIDKTARRTFQKYRLHLNGWSFSQDKATQAIIGTPSDTPPPDDPLVITTGSSLPDAVVGTSYTEVDLAVTGGTGPYVWSVAFGAFLAGISMDSTGAITGTPTAGGVVSASIKVTDSKGAFVQKTFFMQSEAPIISTSSPLPDGTVAVAYAGAFAAFGGTFPYNWSLMEGALPPGMELGADGSIGGTPSFYGAFVFGVTVTDAWGVNSESGFSLTINI